MRDRILGVAWYYNPEHDGRPDGRHREFLKEGKWSALDAPLFWALTSLQESHSVGLLEQLQIWPRRTLFHRIPVPSKTGRADWATGMREALSNANVVFLDPDNGLGKASPRHATASEIAALRMPGRAIVLIRFPGRERSHGELVAEYHESLRVGTGALSVTTVRTSVIAGGVPTIRWFTLLDGDEQLTKRAETYALAISAIDRCRAVVVRQSGGTEMQREDAYKGTLRLIGLLEKALRVVTPDQSAPFFRQLDINRNKFSDPTGITDARRVRNQIAHGEEVSGPRAAEAYSILRLALSEMLSYCPERLKREICAETNLPARSSSPVSDLPKTSDFAIAIQSPDAISEQPLKAQSMHPFPACDWVYFATPAQEDWPTTEAIVTELGLIIRPVYDRREPPNAVSNVRNIRKGQTILLAFGGQGEGYRPMLICRVVAPVDPVPGFESISFANDSDINRLELSGYTRDPHLKRFTGISVEPRPVRFSASIRKPLGNTTIRRWKEVESVNKP